MVAHIQNILFLFYESLGMLSCAIAVFTLASPACAGRFLPLEPCMKYLLMCQIKPAQFADVPPEAQQHMQDAMLNYNQQLIGAGVLVAAGQLAMPHEAVTVTAVPGAPTQTRGPGLAGDTQIGGYYVLDVPGEAEAVAWAIKCPLARIGALEVRQVAFSPL
jgi:hypothetical protein